MKRVLTLLLVACMLISLCSVIAFAEEEPEGFDPYAAPDDSTVRVLSYEAGSEGIGNWLNKFDGFEEDSPCIGTATAAFNAAAPIKAVVFRYIWAGISANDQDADLMFELFPYNTDINTSCAGTALYSETRHYDGDKKLGVDAEKDYCIFKLTETVPAGKYVIRLSQLGEKGTNEQNGRYVVIPTINSVYASTHVEFGDNSFGFMLDCEKTEGVTDYFLPIKEIISEFTLDKEQTVSKRDSDLPHNIIDNHGGEYAILTPVIPEGKVLYSINIVAAPTWENKEGNSNVDVYVYKWKGDYDASVEGRCLLETRKEGHRDNSDLVIEFDGQTLRYGNDNRYLIVIQAYEGAIGYWGCTTVPEEWAFFGNSGEELDFACPLKYTLASVGDLGPEPTEAPTEVPTEKPTAAPTEEPAPTDEPAAETVEPAKTDEPAAKTSDPGKKTEKKDNNILPIIILAVCAVIVIACLAVVFISKKKKKG